jgi:hypothetical protein
VVDVVFIHHIKIANVDNKLAASLHIDYTMLLELRNAVAERVSHCGVLEFNAEEGMIYMPHWVGIPFVFFFFSLGTSTAIFCMRCLLVI